MVIVCLEGQAAALHERNRIWGHRVDSRERVDRFGERSLNAVNLQRPDWVSGSFFYPRLQAHQIGRDNELVQERDVFFRFFQQE